MLLLLRYLHFTLFISSRYASRPHEAGYPRFRGARHVAGLAATTVCRLMMSATKSDITGLCHSFLRVILDLQTGHFGFFLIEFSMQTLQTLTLLAGGSCHEAQDACLTQPAG